MKSNAPEIIYATVNGARTDVLSGRSQLIGGWEEHDRENPRATRYVRQPHGYPCSMEKFVNALLAECDEFEIHDAVKAWVNGDWAEAVFPLSAKKIETLISNASTEQGGAA
ncbi:hypothetical protein V6767_12900 [Martelella sp. FLE1502]